VPAIYFAARDPRVPWYAKALALLVAGYAVSPIDSSPISCRCSAIWMTSVILPLGILAVVKLTPTEVMAEHRAIATRASERPTSRMAAVVIVLVWAASLALVAW
jgi:uncharacterized membrane protein YkvA (DUF1232 family)